MQQILQHYTNDGQIFVKQILAMKEELMETSGCKTTDFLTMREQQIVTTLIGNSLHIKWCGGYEHAERKIAVLANSEEELADFDEDAIITKLFIKYNKRYGSIFHRATLGSLLSLGIDRKVLGDIIITPNKSYLLVSTSMTQFIVDHLEKIGRTRVELLVTSDEIPYVEEEYIEKTIFVKSLRIDSLLSFALNLSREKTKEHIEGNNVQINWQITSDPAAEFEAGSVISVRKYGRVYIDEVMPIRSDGKYKLKIRQLT